MEMISIAIWTLSEFLFQFPLLHSFVEQVHKKYLWFLFPSFSLVMLVHEFGNLLWADPKYSKILSGINALTSSSCACPVWVSLPPIHPLITLSPFPIAPQNLLSVRQVTILESDASASCWWHFRTSVALKIKI